MNEWTDFAAFAEAQVATKDMDPVYPVLRYIERNMSEDEALELTLLYLAYYRLDSGLRAVDLPWFDLAARNYPCATERRGHRNPVALAAHIESMSLLRDAFGGWREWLEAQGMTWAGVTAQAQRAHGNARWAAFKLCELLQQVHDWPLKAPDIAADGATGPLYGLRLLLPSWPEEQRIASGGEEVLTQLRYSYGVSLSLEEVETALCDFHALAEGRYYVGYSIDEMLEQALSCPDVDVRSRILEARYATLPHEMLGELNGWEGVRRELKPVYRDTGVIAR